MTRLGDVFKRRGVIASGDASVSVGGNVDGPVTTTYIQNQFVGISVMPLARAAKDPRPVFRAADVTAFTGREWLADEVDRFIAGHPCGYVFIEAEAGLGKTAFAAWLAMTRGYPSHFSRYSGGSSVEGALANLSAQLITQFGLDDQAPGGMLPQWVQTPSGFESLLTVAADRAHERGQPVVLVVDGLDEADAPAGDLSFGLPALLPDGAYVIATYRTGQAPGRPGVPMTTVRIAKEDRRNQRDISNYLAKVVGEDVLAARLADAEMDAQEFTSLLAGRCNGVWVYLRYVLDDLRLGLRRPDDISSLPSDLRNYYASQVRRWREDTEWHTGLLPLLATLGVAGEALPAASLARLAGNIDPATVQRWCDLAIRPMLTATRILNGSEPTRYSIYHASFREFLNADHSDPSTSGANDQPYEILAMADELRQAASTAHSRICDIYLSQFGGLENGLPELTENPGAAGADGGYALRYLAYHLCQAGRTADLHALLAAELPGTDGYLVSTWFAVHDYDESIISYLNDLGRARSAAENATDQNIIRSQAAPSLGTEMRYGLMAASIASYTANISPAILRQLVRTGTWSSQRVLDHARRLADPERQLDALLMVYGNLNDKERAVVEAQALAAATAVPNDHARAGALTRLGPHLPPALLAQALAAAIAIPDDYYRAVTLAGLAPYLPADQQPAVLAQALAAATEIAGQQARANALTVLGPHLPADLLAQALAAATAIPNSYHRAVTLAGLAPHMPADQQPAVLTQALAAATAIADDYYRAEALNGLTRHLPPDQPALLAQAMATATAFSNDYFRAEALAGLAPHLPADQQPTVLAQALAAAIAIANDYDRAEILTALAPYLPADQQPAVLAQALAAAIATCHIPLVGAKMLTALAPHLRADLLAEALAAAIAIPEDFVRAEGLAGLAPYLGRDLLAEALAAAIAIPVDGARAVALTGLAPHVPADQQPTVLAQALAAAAAIPNHSHRAEVLVELAPLLPAGQQPAVLAEALAATAIPLNSDRAKALTALALHLRADQQPAILTEALTVAVAIQDGCYRAEALTGLAPHLAADQQPAVLAQALAAVAAIPSGSARAQALTALAPHLPSDQLAQALAAAIVIDNDFNSGQALAALAPHLPPDLLAQAVAAATDIPNSIARGAALAGLAPHLPADLLAQALAAATDIAHGSGRAEALVGLAPYLPSDLLAQVLTIATAIPNAYHRASMLKVLALLLPDQEPAVLTQAVTAATAIPNDVDRAGMLTLLAPLLPADQRPAVLAQALAAANTDTGKAAAAAIASGDDVNPDAMEADRLIVLAWLAHLLPADQQPAVLAQALSAATAIPEAYFRSEALTVLAPYLPADQQSAVLVQALNAAIAISEESDRTHILTWMAQGLPADLLPWSIKTVPKTSAEVLTALLQRGRSVIPRAEDAAYLDLLRESINGASRSACLGVLTVSAPAIAEIGGTQAIEQCVNAVVDVHRWWP
jgi:hypothetical protein